MSVAPKLSFDFRDLRCPTPVVKIDQAIRQIQVGEVVEGVSTDPAVMTDIATWAHKSGNEVVCLEKRENDYHFVIRRSR